MQPAAADVRWYQGWRCALPRTHRLLGGTMGNLLATTTRNVVGGGFAAS